MDLIPVRGTQNFYLFHSLPRESDTFKHKHVAAQSFNSLLGSFSCVTDYASFVKATRMFLFQKAKLRGVYMYISMHHD